MANSRFAADPCAILGLAPNCSESDVKKAYRSLALKNHPDKAGPDGVEKMMQINDAYEKLITRLQKEQECHIGEPWESTFQERHPAPQTKEQHQSRMQPASNCSSSFRDNKSNSARNGSSPTSPEFQSGESPSRSRFFTFDAWPSSNNHTLFERDCYHGEWRVFEEVQFNSTWEQIRRLHVRAASMHQRPCQRAHECHEQYRPYARHHNQHHQQSRCEQEAPEVHPYAEADPWTSIHQSFAGDRFRVAWTDPDPPESSTSQRVEHKVFRHAMQRFEAHVFAHEPNLPSRTDAQVGGYGHSRVHAFDAQGEDLLKNLHHLWQSGASFAKLWYEVGRLHYHLKCFKLAHAYALSSDMVPLMQVAGFHNLARYTGVHNVLQSAERNTSLGGDIDVSYMWANAGFFASARELDEMSYRRFNGNLPTSWEEIGGEII